MERQNPSPKKLYFQLVFTCSYFVINHIKGHFSLQPDCILEKERNTSTHWISGSNNSTRLLISRTDPLDDFRCFGWPLTDRINPHDTASPKQSELELLFSCEILLVVNYVSIYVNNTCGLKGGERETGHGNSLTRDPMWRQRRPYSVLDDWLNGSPDD